MINPCHRGTHAGVTAMTQYTRGAGGSRTPTDPAGPVSPRAVYAVGGPTD